MGEHELEDASPVEPLQLSLTSQEDEAPISPQSATENSFSRLNHSLAQAPSGVLLWVASRPAGQLLLRSLDRVLRVLERTLLWYAQRSRNGGDSNSVVVSRPLPWLVLLPVLGCLLYTSFLLRIVFGFDSTAMLHWLHHRRQRLRAIRNAGVKKIRREQALHCSWRLGPLSALLWFFGFSQSDEHCQSTPITGEPHASEKRKHCEVEQSDWTDESDEELHLKIEKYCENYNSDSDPDFEPSSNDGDASGEDASTSNDLECEEDDGMADENGRFSRSDSVIPEPPTPVDDDGIAVGGVFAGSPMPLAAVPSVNESKVVRFFVPFVRRMSRGKQELRAESPNS